MAITVVSIKDIVRKDVPIYYRRLFSGLAVLKLMDKTLERKIDFSIETKPTGSKDVSITLMEPVDYPLLPLITELKRHINNLDTSGGLPG
jgi:hypothetical protein